MAQPQSNHAKQMLVPMGLTKLVVVKKNKENLRKRVQIGIGLSKFGFVASIT